MLDTQSTKTTRTTEELADKLYAAFESFANELGRQGYSVEQVSEHMLHYGAALGLVHGNPHSLAETLYMHAVRAKQFAISLDKQPAPTAH